MLDRFFAPFGRPLGFPERPLTNCVCTGGLPYPPSSPILLMGNLRQCCELMEGLAAVLIHCNISGVRLPATDRRIHVKRIDLDAMTDATYYLGGNQGSARAQEAVQDKIAASGAVEQSVRHQSDWFHSWMQSEQIAFSTILGKSIRPRIFPYVRAVASESSQ